MKLLKVLAIVLVAFGSMSCEKELLFTDTGTFEDDRDGNIYEWVKIGEQTWMAENLAYLPKINGYERDDYYSPQYFVYGYDGQNETIAKSKDNYIMYGALYNWEAAIAACPDGWHLPTDEEWMILEKHLGMKKPDTRRGGTLGKSGEVGMKLKSTSGWENNSNGNNSSGFEALPGGQFKFFIDDVGYVFEDLGSGGIFWTSSENPTNQDEWAYSRHLSWSHEGIFRGGLWKSYGYSVRCLKD